MVMFWARVFNRFLLEEIEYLKGQVEHERQRAENAIDELIRIRVGAGPVTQPTPREMTKNETLVQQMLNDTEFATVGDVQDDA